MTMFISNFMKIRTANICMRLLKSNMIKFKALQLHAVLHHFLFLTNPLQTIYLPNSTFKCDNILNKLELNCLHKLTLSI